MLDEAYTEYLAPADRADTVAWVRDFPNLLVVRTFSKIYGLAGLRIGYGVGRSEVIEECGVLGEVVLVAISKGPDRHAGREKFFIEGRVPFQLPVYDPVLHFLQRLRDEAHRFAIAGHRGKRQKQMVASPLDDVPGIGATGASSFAICRE